MTTPPAPGEREPARLTTRLFIGGAGVALAGYGVYRILSQPRLTRPTELLRWLITAVVVHDGLLVPATMIIGAGLTALVPARARRYLQGVLVAIALLTPPVLVEIHRRGSQPTAKALVGQNYAAHLVWIAATVAGLGLAAYLVRRYRDHGAGGSESVSRTNTRPSASHDPE